MHISFAFSEATVLEMILYPNEKELMMSHLYTVYLANGAKTHVVARLDADTYTSVALRSLLLDEVRRVGFSSGIVKFEYQGSVGAHRR